MRQHRSRPRKLAISLLLALLLAPLLVSTVEAPQAAAAGPCRITGYTIHARLMMSTRDISKSEVVSSVNANCSHGEHQSNGNWKYKSYSSFLPTVILSSNGTVVTAYWEGSGGGGGGGGGGGW